MGDLPTPVAEFTVETATGTPVLVITGEIDISTAPQLREHLQQLDAHEVVVDLTAMTFIDSTGLGVLVGAVKRLHESGGDLVLRHPSRSTRKVLDISGLAQMVKIED
jgi:anti-sigma B factor antagonist